MSDKTEELIKEMRKHFEECKIAIINLQERVDIMESVIFSTPVEDVPETVKAKPKKQKIISIDKVRRYIESESVSKTELVEICNRHNLKMSTMMNKDDVIQQIKGENIITEDPLADIREKTEIYFKENNISKSTRGRCKMNCPKCPEHRVVLCWKENGTEIEKFHNYRR